ncbi:Cof-type HAD-IIB family hydrolase [Vibrio metschnikovii]|uniref:Cof-type HAD-IIB family hydrolase n=1 Tax=Vibrio metschnikovii TaxID=28172 RepID=A0A9X0UK05_VIBME|nr:Cof-type HAD-IIB family hydrolase [Vibrio metschnikovii]MBC5852426.1 Cof-type HAD-IIB family hydrolase [Vibrio metschnikovii]MDA3139862.1 Cof-type HAD-IIB family hydrolase [Vibrio metschnikovii]
MTTEQTTPVRIVASDLDGTLLAPNHQLSEITKQTLHALHQQGFTFVFATGRHHIDVAGIREIAGIPAYMITSNGARVHDQHDKELYSKNVPAELVQAIIDLVKHDDDIYVHIYRDDDWLLNREDEVLRHFHEDSGFTYQVFDVNAAPNQGVAKIFFTNTKQDHEQLVHYENLINQHFAGQLSVAFSTPWCLEVMGAEVSKGEALQAIAQSLGLTLEHCIAFGDGMNDVEMLSMAGKGLVMGTAHEKVFRALPNNTVIGSHADDAVAHYLQQHLLGHHQQ